MKILVIGFEPFGGSKINPSEQVVREIRQKIIAGAQIVTAVLPVDWVQGPEALIQALQTSHPDAVLCLGEAAGRASLAIERVAINLLDFRIPDNSGAKIIDQPIIDGGPAAYFVMVDPREICEAMLSAGIPAELSLSAGTYLCNEVLYQLLHFLNTEGWNIPAAFIHLPCLPQQVADAGKILPSMSLETMISGVSAAVDVMVRQAQSQPTN